MLIDISHRDLTEVYPTSVYLNVADEVCRVAGLADGTISILLFGSVVKDDVVPGWSDIDVMVFLEKQAVTRASFEHLARAVGDIQKNVRIGIGLDIIYIEDFRERKR